MDQIALISKSMEMTYHQTISRIKMRDNVIMIYLAAVAGIFGVFIESEKVSEIILLIPYLALGASIMFAHHSIFIGSALDYSNYELKKYLDKKFLGEDLPLYEMSSSFHKNYKKAIWLANVGSAILIIMPCIGSLILYKNLQNIDATWWFALIIMLISVVVLIAVHYLRLQNMKYKWGSLSF